MHPPFPIAPLADDPALPGLIARAFADNPRTLSPDRLAARLRGDARPLHTLWFAMREDGALVASVQAWRVRLLAAEPVELALIGPVAVAPERQGQGLGHALMARVTERLDRAAVLVGDPQYYAAWGFSAEHTAGWDLDGAVERERLLARPADRPLPRQGRLVPG